MCVYTVAVYAYTSLSVTYVRLKYTSIAHRMAWYPATSGHMAACLCTCVGVSVCESRLDELAPEYWRCHTRTFQLGWAAIGYKVTCVWLWASQVSNFRTVYTLVFIRRRTVSECSSFFLLNDVGFVQLRGARSRESSTISALRTSLHLAAVRYTLLSCVCVRCYATQANVSVRTSKQS